MNEATAKAARGLALALAVLGATGCGEAQSEQAPGGSACAGAKCDDVEEGTSGEGDGGEGEGAYDEYPDDLEMVCDQRKDEAFVEGREAFSRDVLRWSCNDVPGTAPEDRGQEYCEYFALVAVPGYEAIALGKLSETKASTEETDQEVDVSPAGLSLDDEVIAALEADPYAEAGRCVFTSWNADVDACESDACAPTDVLYDIAVDDADTFRMVYDANTFEAAEALVADCMEYVVGVGDPSDPDDLYHDDFMRACELNSVVNETEYRKSDSTVCASAMRLAECGCRLDSDETTLAAGLSREGELGFPLGGWEGADVLPAGCRYESPRPGARSLVTCELTALEVLDNAAELKSYCAMRYADDIVVHVPVPADSILCEPDPDSEVYAKSCGDQPWNVAP